VDCARTRSLPAPTVNFHMAAQRSPVELWLMVKIVPVALAPVERKRQRETVTPSPAAPPTVFVCS
jgi:hypothetical protein